MRRLRVLTIGCVSSLCALCALLYAEPRAAASTPAQAADLNSTSHPRDVLLSRQLMAQAGVKPGDIVTLAADAAGTRARQFRVSAMYEPTPDPMRFTARRLEARLHLPDLLGIAADPNDPDAADAVQRINMRVHSSGDAATDSEIRTLAAALGPRAPGLQIDPTRRAPDTVDAFAVLERFNLAIAIVTVLGSTAFLLALMVMRAEERRSIIGILRLMGIPPRSILIEVLFEGMMVALAGAVFGVLVAAAGQTVVNRFFQWHYDTTLLFVRVTVGIAWRSIAFAVPMGVLAGLAASWTLLRQSAMGLVSR